MPVAMRTTLVALSLWVAGLRAVAQDKSPPEPEVLGGAAAFDLAPTTAETVWIDAGMPLFRDPDPTSDRLAVFDAVIELEVLESQGDWHKVRFGSRLGWVQPDLPWKDRLIQVHEALDSLEVSVPTMKLEAMDHLAAAVRVMGATAARGRLGPWDLLTDMQDETALRELDAVASHLESTYRERFGLALDDTGRQTLSLFATEALYRAFEEETTDTPRADRHGHAIGNVASLFVGDKESDEVRQLLVHEATHLLNRRALGDRPPAWIEEGLASDLGYCQADRQGRLRAGTLGGSKVVFGTRYDRQVTYTGGLSALSKLLDARARRQGTPLAELVDMPHDAFMAAQARQLHYIESGFLVRLLMDGPKSAWRDGFRKYLAELSAGKAPDAARLAELLGARWSQVERTLDSWLRVQAVKLLP